MGNSYIALGAAYTSPTGSLQIGRYTTAQKWAQSFKWTAGSKALLVRFGCNVKTGTPDGAIYFNIYSGGTIGAGSLLGTTESMDPANMTNGTYYSLCLPSGISMTIGDSYWLEGVSTNTIDSTNYFSTYYLGTGLYADGELKVWNGSAWVAPAGATPDSWFYVGSDADGGFYQLDGDGTGTDNNITLANLITYKDGSSPSVTDTISVWNGKRLWIQDGETLSYLKIWLGDNAGSAVTAGQRYGELITDGGCSLIVGGSATATANGISSNPASADSSSLNCKWTRNLSNGKDIILTNSVDSADTNKRYIINFTYGQIDTIRGWSSINNREPVVYIKNTYAQPVNTISCDSTKTSSGQKFTNNVFSGIMGAATPILLTSAIGGYDLVNDFRNNKFDYTGLTNSASFSLIGNVAVTSKIVSGGDILYDNMELVSPGLTGYISPIILYSNTGTMFFNGRAAFADITSLRKVTFYLDKTVVSVTAGTVITVTLDNNLASVMTGLTLKGVACTDRTVTGANTLTFVAPTLTAGIGDVVGTFTGYDNYTITNGITAQAGASAPEAFLANAVAWGVQSVKVGWGASAGALTYRIFRDTVDVSGELRNVSTFIDSPVVAGTYSYVVKAYSAVGDTPSNTVTLVKGAGGLATLYGVLSAIYRAMFNMQKIEKVGSTYYLNTYDDNDTTLVASCALKTFDEADIGDLAGTVTPSIRLKSAISGVGVELTGTIWSRLQSVFKKEFNTRKNEEVVVGSGVISEVVYDDNDTTRISQQALKTFNGSNLPSQLNTTTPSQRIRSSI